MKEVKDSEEMVDMINLEFQLVAICKADREIRLLFTEMYLSRESIHAFAIYT